MTGRRPRVVISIYDDSANPHYGGGGPTVVRRIVESLAADHDVLVLVGGYPGARRSRRHGATYLPLPVGWAGPRVGQLLFTLVLLLVAALAPYDLWIESFTPPFSSSFLPAVTRRPVLGLAQALSGREMSRRYRTQLFHNVERLALRRYDDVVVLNEHDAARVALCSPQARVHHIANIVPAVQADVGDAADGRYALFLGRIDFGPKGLGLLFDAYRQADGALPLVIAGSGRRSDLRDLERALATAGPGVRWVGHVNGAEKEAVLAGCGFVVVPSREESFSLVALEALAHGRPVVHFDLPQLAWIPSECGVAVPCFDTALLAQAALGLSVDVARRSAAGHAARAFAERFLAGQGADAYTRLVQELLTGRPLEVRGAPSG